MGSQPNEARYGAVIERCRSRIRHYEMLESWLLSVQQSEFGTDSVARIREAAREGRLSAITRQVREDLSVRQGGWDDLLRPVLEILVALNSEDEYVYDAVLLACDTAEPKNLESALAAVRYCQSRAEQALRIVPQAAARRRRYEASNAMRRAALKGSLKGNAVGSVIGAVVGLVSCIAVTLGDPTVGEGANIFFGSAAVGSVLGTVSGYVSARRTPPGS